MNFFDNKSGFVGILALWLIVIIATILTTYTYIMIEENRLMRTIQQGIYSEYNAIAGVHLAISKIMNDRQPSSDIDSIILNEVKISETHFGRYIEFIEIYNPLLYPVALTDFTITIEAGEEVLERAGIISWNEVSSSNVGLADTVSTILNPGHYAIILSTSFVSDTQMQSYYDTMIPSNAIVYALDSDTLGDPLGSIILGGGLVIPDTWANNVVIHEVCIGGATGSGANNEYVELFNPTGSAIDLSGWQLRRQRYNGDEYLYVNLTGSIPAFGYYLVAGVDYPNDFDAQRTATTGHYVNNEQAILRNMNETIVDAVAWGDLDTGVCIFGEPLPEMNNNTHRVVTRRQPTPSNNNSLDFFPNNFPTPQRGNFNIPPQPEDTTTISIILFDETDFIADQVFFDTSFGQIVYERNCFRNRTGITANDWTVITNSIPLGDFHLLGTPGSLNLSVKFSSDVDNNDNFPYIQNKQDWWNYSEDMNNDGNINFSWKLRPSLSKFNLNENFNRNNTNDSYVLDNKISYFFGPSIGRNIYAKNLPEQNIDFKKELGDKFIFPDDIVLISGVGENTAKNFQASLTVYPSDIGLFRLFPININAVSDSALINILRVNTKNLSASRNTAELLNGIVFDEYSTSDDSPNGALMKFINTLKNIPNQAQYWGSPASTAHIRKYNFIKDAVSGNYGIPLIFGSTNIIGKYTYWELIVEGYDNWVDDVPRDVMRIKADIAIPVYSNQIETPEIIFWSQNCITNFWTITDF